MREAGEELGRPSGVVRRPQVGKFWKQVAVRPDLVLRHLPVCVDSHENVTGVVGERPAIAREGCRAGGIIRQHVRSSVRAARLASSGAYPPTCSRACAKTDMK